MDGGTYHLKASKYRNCHYLGNYDVPILKSRFLDSIKLNYLELRSFLFQLYFKNSGLTAMSNAEAATGGVL